MSTQALFAVPVVDVYSFECDTIAVAASCEAEAVFIALRHAKVEGGSTMSWAELNAHADINRDRRFRIVLRPSPDVDLAQVVDVEVASSTMVEMAKHGPIPCVLNAHVLNLAQTHAWPEMAWWGDAIRELQ
jgi:hypothetical protein